MSHQPGKMGVAEGTVLAFFTTVTSVFLSRWTEWFDQAATAVWLVTLIGIACFITMFLLLLFVMERVPGDLLEVSERLLGKAGARLIIVYLVAAFFGDAVLMLRQFGENTLLTAIPDLNIALIIGW